MTHKHFLFLRHVHLLHEGREIFFADGPESGPNPADKPAEDPNVQKKTPEQVEKEKLDAQAEAKQKLEDAKLISDTQQKALNMVNAELKKWNDAQTEEKKSRGETHEEVKNFNELPEDTRADIRDTVMQSTGANVSETGAITVAKSDIGMNKVMGTVGKLGRQIGKMFDKLRPLLEKLGMKFDDKSKKDETKKGEENKEAEKTPEDKNKEKGLEAMKKSGIKFIPENALTDPKATEYQTKATLEGEQDWAPSFKIENGLWQMKTVKRGNTWQPLWKMNEKYAEGKDDPDAIACNKLINELGKGNVDSSKEKTENDAAKKAKEKMDAITSDKWERSNDPTDTQSYKKAADGRIYRTDGERTAVFVDGKLVDAAMDAGIKDPETMRVYDAVLAQGGDREWVRYGYTQHLYRIDLKTKSLYSSTTVGGNMQYQPGTNTWQYRTFPIAS